MRTLFNVKVAGKDKEFVLVYDFFAVVDTMMILIQDESAGDQIARLVLKIDPENWEIFTDGSGQEFYGELIRALDTHFLAAGYKFHLKYCPQKCMTVHSFRII